MFKNAITYLVTPVFCLNPEILARSYVDGRRAKPQITNRDNKGRITA